MIVKISYCDIGAVKISTKKTQRNTKIRKVNLKLL